MTQTGTAIWPAGKTCAAMISVLFDDGLDAVAQAPDLPTRSKSFSVWKYGAARGVERLCRTFAGEGVRTSWFVPASVAQEHTDLVRAVADAGHDIESHGWAFEHYDAMQMPQAVDLLRRSRDLLGSVTGREVTGFRLPVGNWPYGFDALLKKAGYSWSASLNGDDLPYLHSSGLAEIPVHIELEDRPYFQFNFTPAFPKGQGRIPSYEAVLSNWIVEFDAYRKFGLCYVLQLRPEWTGTPGRIFLVEQLLRHIRSFDDVWIATGAEIAAWHLATGAPPPEQHPIHVYAAYHREHR